MLVIAGTIRIDPTKKDEAAAAAREMMRATQEESGNLAYAFSSDLSEPGVFYIFEKWESQAALDEHFQAPHMAAFRNKVGGLGVKEMNLEKYEIASVGPVS